MASKPFTPFDLATYGSVLRRPLLRWPAIALLVLLLVFTIRKLSPLLDLEHPDNLRVFLLALGVTAAITLIPVTILAWLDRREPEPAFMYVIALLLGGFVATAVSLEFNTVVSQHLHGFLTAVVGAPLVEELAKAFAILLIVLLLRGEFDGPRDGLLYGVLVGLGFIWLETSVYIAREYEKSGNIPWAFQLTSRYVLFGFNGHGLYAGITGLYIGWATTHRSWLRKIILIVAGILVAVLSHIFWNTAGVVVTGITGSIFGSLMLSPEGMEAFKANPVMAPIYVTWPAGIIAALVAGIVPYAVFLIGLRKSNRWERKVMEDQLADEARPEIVRPDEWDHLVKTGEPPKDNSSRARFAALCNLAKRKFRLRLHRKPVDGDPVVEAWREAIRRSA